ncbi:MAG: hypothetical protein QG644_241, partial [Patescibacteria group bacterium]|nr:hypothetical protein [Patescibacteria group bacterium]
MKRGIFLNVFIVTLLLLSVLPFSSEAQTVMPEVLSTSVTGPAGTLNLEIYIPTGTTSPKPAVVFIPGNGEVGTSRAKLYTNGPLNFIKNSGWRPDFIVVGAQPSGTWPNNAFTHTVLSHLVATPSYYIDTNKIYLTGLSAGAEAIDTYIKTQSNPVGLAAVVPMSITYEASCGDFYAQTDYLCGNDLKWATIPAWGFAGSNDSHWEKMRRFFYLMIDAGYNTRWTTYSGGHSGWNAFYNPTYEETINGVSMNIYEWMLQYSRGGTPPPPPTNTPPTANAGTDKTITLPTNSVSLTGSGTDTGGSISSYAWTKVSGGSATIASPSSATTNITGLVQGSYTFRLTVTDNGGLTATDDVVVTVNA